MDIPDPIMLGVRLKLARQRAAVEAELGLPVTVGIYTEWSTQQLSEDGIEAPRGAAEVAGGHTFSSTQVRVPGGLWLQDLRWLDSSHRELDLEVPLPVTGVARRLVRDTETGRVSFWNWRLSVENPALSERISGVPLVDLGPEAFRATMLRAMTAHDYLEVAVPGALEAWQRGISEMQGYLSTSLELLPGMRLDRW